MKYASRQTLYSVPNVFVTLDGATVVARAARALRAAVDAPRDCWGGALRTTVLVRALRAVVWVVFALRGLVAVRATVWDVVAPRAVDDARDTVFVVPPRAVAVRVVDTAAGVRVVVRAITVWEFVFDVVVDCARSTEFVPRTAAPAFAMLMQHAMTKNKNLFIPVVYNMYIDDNKNIFY